MTLSPWLFWLMLVGDVVLAVILLLGVALWSRPI